MGLGNVFVRSIVREVEEITVKQFLIIYWAINIQHQ